MNNLGIKLKHLRESKKLTQKELAIILGLKSYTTVGKWESGDNYPRGKELKQLADFFNVSADYLLGIESIDNIIPIQQLVKVPIIGTIACGIPLLADQNIIGYEYVASDTVKGKEVFFLECKGDSMEPKIPDGSLVLVNNQPTVENGEIAAVIVNGDDEATLKRVQYQNDTLILIAENSDYPPYVVTKDNSARIIGKAIQVTTKL